MLEAKAENIIATTVTSQISSLTTYSFSHCYSSTLATLLFFKHTKNAPTKGPLRCSRSTDHSSLPNIHKAYFLDTLLKRYLLRGYHDYPAKV